MEEITFSVFNHGPAAQKNLQTLMEKFEQLYGVHVKLDVVALSSLRWPKLVEAALYHSGPDVSETGNSWVGDLIRMDALRPFSVEEVAEIVGDEKYFESVWQGSTRYDHGIPTIYSIPLAADVRAIFYRHDLFKQAGIDEAMAFKDISSFEQTLILLRNLGIEAPLVIPNRRSNMTLHCSASWVWSAGGDFLTPDGTSVAFDQPAALEGFKAYFRLVRHLVPVSRDLEEQQADAAFCQGKSAVLLSGFWIPESVQDDLVKQNLHASPMPGHSFVGGGDMVIWNHSRHESAALRLVQFCHSTEAGELLYPGCGLPISDAGWNHPPFDLTVYQVLKNALQTGRSFPPARLWGLVEKRLTDTLADIWAEVLKSPENQLEFIVETRLKTLAQRMQLSLGA